MNVLFDKAMYEKGRSLDSNNNKVVDEKDEGKSIEMAIKESLANGKVGSLNVDPNYLTFEPLASEYILAYNLILLQYFYFSRNEIFLF